MSSVHKDEMIKEHNIECRQVYNELKNRLDAMGSPRHSSLRRIRALSHISNPFERVDYTVLPNSDKTPVLVVLALALGDSDDTSCRTLHLRMYGLGTNGRMFKGIVRGIYSPHVDKKRQRQLHLQRLHDALTALESASWIALMGLEYSEKYRL